MEIMKHCIDIVLTRLTQIVKFLQSVPTGFKQQSQSQSTIPWLGSGVGFIFVSSEIKEFMYSLF